MKKILIAALGAGLLLGSCTKDFEEINKNPNVPEDYLTYALFNGNNQTLMSNTRGYDNMKQMRVWMQYAAQPIYTKESRYLLDKNGGETLYLQLYKRAMGYKVIVERNTNPETKDKVSVYGKNENQIAAARIMMSYCFTLLVQSFGDVPYYSLLDPDNPKFQALQTDTYVTPVFASQKDIYLDILKELDQAVSEIDTSTSNVFTEGDLLFGTPGKMKRFANSLRLRIANHLKGANATVLGTELKQKVTDIINYYTATTHDDELLGVGERVELPFEDNYTYPTPIYYDYYVGNRVDYLPSSNFVKLLTGHNKKANDRGLGFGVDPRMEKYFAPKGLGKWDVYYGYTLDQSNPIDTTKYVGMPYGMQEGATTDQYNGGDRVSLFSKEILSATAAEVMMDYSEICFILSELRGWDNALYRKGVEASLDRWGITGTRKSDFMTSLPAANEERVLTQKYISLYMDPDEAWAEYRRTGYPKTLIKLGERVRANYPTNNPLVYEFKREPSATDVEGIPDRINYPDTYTGLNLNYIEALKNMGNPNNQRSQKLIFATRQ